MINQQVVEAFIPMVESLFNEKTLCTFILHLCNQEEYTPIDLDKWIQELISKKPDHVKDNNFVNE